MPLVSISATRASTADTRATQPAETLSVNKSLTTESRQSIVDNVPEQAAALAAIDRAQALARNAEEELAMTVTRARESGHTWAEIGQILGTSRQAAFQRFGRPADRRMGTVDDDRTLQQTRVRRDRCDELAA